MKLFSAICNLFRKKEKELTISEILERDNNTVRYRHVGRRTWVVLYDVCDMDNGYKAIAQGFYKRADAVQFAETCGKRWLLTMVEKEVTKEA